MTVRSLFLSLIALVLAAPAWADGEAAPEASARSKVYSPFAVELEGAGAFRVITFEDVGMALDDASAALLYEAISESVAAELDASDAFDYVAEPVYEPGLADPSEHVYCDDHHLYVALWRGFEPHRWGFSLWSGCGADDQFAWHEVIAPFDGATPVADLVEPLAKAVVAALGRAEATRCFQLSC